MEDREIRERARKIAHAFAREETRVAGDMECLIKYFRLIARDVACGEYHRAGIFIRAVDTLRDLGFDVSEASVRTLPHSDCVREAAENAKDDVRELLAVVTFHRSENPRAHMVVNRAYDLMQCIGGDGFCGNLDARAERLHDAVTEWVDGDGRAVTDEVAGRLTGVAKIVFGECAPSEEVPGTLVSFGTVLREREVPERVLFNPPATIAFWPDGTKTVAKCSGDDEFSEYVGLLVCIAKRHVRVPRRKTFEDVMARLLKRAERA